MLQRKRKTWGLFIVLLFSLLLPKISTANMAQPESIDLGVHR